MEFYCGSILVEVGITHTRFVKFGKGTKHIYLSKSCWDRLSENLGKIDTSLSQGKNYSVDFEKTKKRLQTDTYKGNWMVTCAEE